MKYEITDERIAKLKAQHGWIYALDIEDEDGNSYSAIVKSPDRKTLGAAGAIAAKDPIKFNEVVLNNAWLEGDEEIKNDDQLFLAASEQLGKIVSTAQGKLRKL